jgi:pimeloyl-ACP methyl ester carboxylesterase
VTGAAGTCRRAAAAFAAAVRLTTAMVAGLAAGCDGTYQPAVPGGPPAPAAAFEPASCGLETAPPGLEVSCGRVRVPERRDDPATAQISLQVAIVRARDLPPATRTAIYLDGGAGGSSVQNLIYYAAWTTSRSLRALLADRVLVAIDRRGTGGSLPRLDCPGVDPVPLPADAAGSGLFSAEAIGQCRARLVGEGVSLPAYGTQASADDVEAVRRALGLEGYDLVGASYGARVALEVLRRHPQAVRAAVLDSLTPPDVNSLTEEGPSLERALGLAFGECAADPTCQSGHPDPAQGLAEVVARLDADPVEVSTHGGSVQLDGRTLIQAVASLLAQGHPGADLADRIEEARSGDYGFFAAVLGAPRGAGALGAELAVVCGEQVTATTAAEVEAAAQALSPPVRGSLAARFLALACAPWAAPAAPAAVRGPVTSAKPVLLLTGQRDPISPPGFAVRAARTLSAARLLEIPRQGHQLLHLPCGAAAAAWFLSSPSTTPVLTPCAPASD